VFGKTTILRDLVRNISNGIDEIGFRGINVGMVDERSELSALYKGVPQNDIGIRTDVMENVPKSIGIKMLIRTMAPQVVVADEIGSSNDVEAIKEAATSGVKGIFTAHGDSNKNLLNNPILKSLIQTGIIERTIFLKRIKDNGIISVGIDAYNQLEEKAC